MPARDIEPLRAKLAAEFVTRWNSAGAPFPVEFANQPEGIDKSGTWGRLTIMLADRHAAAIGARHVRLTGVIALQIFALREHGTRDAVIGFDRFAECWDFATITVDLSDSRTGYVIFRSAYQAATMASDEANPAHHQTNINVVFNYDTSRL